MTSTKAAHGKTGIPRVVTRERILKREYPGWEVAQTYSGREKIFQSERAL